MDDLSGQVLERYRILEPLGQGAFGRVYRAQHTLLEREVAIKVLHRDFARDPMFAGRFLREAKVAARFEHEHVVQIIDFAIRDDGTAFLVMELVRGRTLSELLAAGAMEEPRARALLRQMASGLAAIHAHGLVHRDLKPGNIMITMRGGREHAKIMDFGIARDLSDGAEKLSYTGLVIGTPLYMAPEQASSARVDARADVYALGLIAFEMLEGRRPHEGTAPQLIARRLSEPAPRLARAHTLEALVRSMLDVQPERRPDAGAVVEALGDAPRSTDRIRVEQAIAADDVQFTVYRPRSMPPDVWRTLLCFAHLGEPAGPGAPDPIEEVQRQAEQVLGEKLDEYRSTSQDAGLAIPREGELSFVPEMPGVTFNPPRRTFTFVEAVHREELRMKAGAHLAGTTARGRVTVLLGHVLIAEVPLSIRIEGGAERAVEPARARTFRRVFTSYAEEDGAIVAQLERCAELLGDRIVRDDVAGADVFQLFWSTNAMRAPRVLEELSTAIALGRSDFVRPMYWEVPIPRDPARGLPPPELLSMPWTSLASDVVPTAEDVEDTAISGGTNASMPAVDEELLDSAPTRLSVPPSGGAPPPSAGAAPSRTPPPAYASAPALPTTAEFAAIAPQRGRVARLAGAIAGVGLALMLAVVVYTQHLGVETTTVAPIELHSKLEIVTTPPGATIEVDGKDAGVTPATVLDLAPGPHTVTLRLPGHATITRTVDVPSATAIHETLVPLVAPTQP